jgi:O-antigen ligase
MIRTHPIVGVGPDNFLHYYAPTRQENRWQRVCAPGLGYIQPAAGAEPCLSHPHDEFLDFWLSAGILGLLAYLWLLYVFWSRWLTLFRTDEAPWSRPLVLGVGGAMLASMLHGLIDNSYFLVDLSLLFWLLCAIVSWLIGDVSVMPAPVPAHAVVPEEAGVRSGPPLTRGFRVLVGRGSAGGTRR